MIRKTFIALVVAFIGFTAYTGSSDVAASAEATTSKISNRAAAIQAALDEAQ